MESHVDISDGSSLSICALREALALSELFEEPGDLCP